jgi:hypothetical protein
MFQKSRQDVKALGKNRTPYLSTMNHKMQTVVVPVTFSIEI